MLTLWPVSLSAADYVCVPVPVCTSVYECVIYLCSLCLLVQQCQSCQVFQEWVRRIKNLGQEVETFPLIVVQDLDKKKQHQQRTNPGDLTGNVMSVTIHPIQNPIETFTQQAIIWLLSKVHTEYHIIVEPKFYVSTFHWNQCVNNNSWPA